MAYLPNRGDIVHLDFDPSSGREMKGPHFGLVVSGKLFNQHGLAMICPILQGTAFSAQTDVEVMNLFGGNAPPPTNAGASTGSPSDDPSESPSARSTGVSHARHQPQRRQRRHRTEQAHALAPYQDERVSTIREAVGG